MPTLTCDPWETVRAFERAVAEYSGARFGVAVDTCTWAIFLCCKLLGVDVARVPRRTYLGVPVYLQHAGARPELVDVAWRGEYALDPWPIVDSACRFRRGMHRPGTFRCVSFQTRKILKIGRGGMILHDDPAADLWLRRARFLGKDELPMAAARPHFAGWHCFLEPERAARGLQLLAALPDDPEDLAFDYPDLADFEIFQ